LARGINKTAELQINKRLAGYGLSSRVKVNGGWLSTEVLISEIQHATAVVLPFVLVPAELPVSVMEAIACGTPVIVSDIDGLPETAGSAGLVVSPGNAVALAATMQRLAMDNTLQQTLRKACLEQRKGYQSWPVIARLWADVLEVPL
jgi:glycosyltransferase involved in cell wall biosynthesis